MGRARQQMAGQREPKRELNETERKKLDRIGAALRAHAHAVELTDLPDEIAAAMKRLGE